MDEVMAVLGDDGETDIHRNTADLGGITQTGEDIVNPCRCLRLKPCDHACCVGIEPFGGACAEEEDGLGCASLIGTGGWFLEDDVGVGTTKAKGADSGPKG